MSIVFPYIRIARVEEAPLVHSIMQEAFEEYRLILTPPTGALKETVHDVAAAMRKGGAPICSSTSGSVMMCTASMIIRGISGRLPG